MQRLSNIFRKIFVVLAIMSCFPAVGQNVVLSFESSHILIEPGETAKIGLVIDNPDRFMFRGFQTTITLPDGITLESVEPGDALGNTQFSVRYNNQTDRSSIVMLYDVATRGGADIGYGEILVFNVKAMDKLKPMKGLVNLSNSLFSSQAGSELCLDAIVETEIEVFIPNRPATPSQLLRKGDGKSCTFIAMMPLTDAQIAEQGYEFVFGYDNAAGQQILLEMVDVRYCHTSESIYNNPANDFWVFVCKVDETGSIVSSERRHLDGRVDDDFDAESIITQSHGPQEVGHTTVYSLQGIYMSDSIDGLKPGTYIVSEKSGLKYNTQKIVIR